MIYHVCSAGALITPRSDVLLPGSKFDTEEHNFTKEALSALVKAGRISKDGIRRGRFPTHNNATIPHEQTVDSPEVAEKEEKAAKEQDKIRAPSQWTFSDEDLRGRNLADLNALISERGGAVQETEDAAMALLQSEL